MRISREKFEELVSAYLDNEVTSRERRRLSKCIRSDAELAHIFRRQCKIYVETCKIYGRKPHLANLPRIPNPLIPPEKYLAPHAKSEWFAAAVLVAAAAVLVMYVAPLASAPEKFPQRDGGESAPWVQSRNLIDKYFLPEAGYCATGDSVGILRHRQYTPNTPHQPSGGWRNF